MGLDWLERIGIKVLSTQDETAELTKTIDRGVAMQRLIENKDWFVVRGVISSLNTETVAELGKRNPLPEELTRGNHRLELLGEISTGFDKILRDGKVAAMRLRKLQKGDENGRG